MTEVKLSSRNQIVIPREAREALGLKAGDKLLVVVRKNPKASDASPSPEMPASVPMRTMSQTVRSVARMGSSSSSVTRSLGPASSRCAKVSPVKAVGTCLLSEPAHAYPGAQGTVTTFRADERRASH